MDDRELVRRIQAGQKEYLNEIAEKYYDDIYYFCCYQTGSREDAYDLAQDTFLRFIRYVEGYRYRNLKGYLLTIAMNLCRNYWRGEGLPPPAAKPPTHACGYDGSQNEAHHACRRNTDRLRQTGNRSPQNPQDTAYGIFVGYGYEDGEKTEANAASQAYESQENILLLSDALLKLPQMQREAVLLHHFYGYKNREIARMTGVSCGTVKSRIRQGIEKLQQLLDKEDFYG